jgi:hypothetical protein
VRITDQGIQQLFAGGRVVPRDRRLARPLVVMPGAVLPDDRGRGGHRAGDPADRGDQLGHRVLGGAPA